MELSTTSPSNTIVQSESMASSESSHSKMTKEIGNMKLSKESQSFESNEMEAKVEQTSNEAGNTSKIENGHVQKSEMYKTNDNVHERAHQNEESKPAELKTVRHNESTGTQEIQQENIKSTLKEIIQEIDQAVAGQEQESENFLETNDKIIPETTSSSTNAQLKTSNSFKYTRPSQCSQSPTEETTHVRNSLLEAIAAESQKKKLAMANARSNGNQQARTNGHGPAEGHEQANEDDVKDPYVPKAKPIDLEKIFTPATDAEEIKPNPNRTMYASSSFYSKGLHPTVEDQVKLAHKISSSLSDASNTKSKGQSMYLNRKKRSVQWVHEQNGQQTSGSTVESESNVSDRPPPPLKLLMNPYGKVQDVNTLRRQTGIEPLSPDITFNVVSALNANKGRGAELFAKRRKKSEKWVVNECQTTQRTISRENSMQQNYAATPMTPLPKMPSLYNLEDNIRNKPQYRPEPQFENYKLTSSETSSTGSHYWDSTKDHLYKPKPPQAWGKSPQQSYVNGSLYKAPTYSQRSYPQTMPQQTQNYAPAKQPAPALPPAPAPLTPLRPSISAGPSFSLYNYNNYNTAPRGWGQVKDYYRPVTFDKKHAPCTGY